MVFLCVKFFAICWVFHTWRIFMSFAKWGSSQPFFEYFFSCPLFLLSFVFHKNVCFFYCPLTQTWSSTSFFLCHFLSIILLLHLPVNWFFPLSSPFCCWAGTFFDANISNIQVLLNISYLCAETFYYGCFKCVHNFSLKHSYDDCFRCQIILLPLSFPSVFVFLLRLRSSWFLNDNCKLESLGIMLWCYLSFLYLIKLAVLAGLLLSALAFQLCWHLSGVLLITAEWELPDTSQAAWGVGEEGWGLITTQHTETSAETKGGWALIRTEWWWNSWFP